MVGLALACGGASALNHYLDRDIDKLMGSRTATAARRLRPRARRSARSSSGSRSRRCSFVLLDSLVNLPTALLALAGNLFYVLVYTRWLKRSTPQNIVIGGAAGAVPPLVGYAGAAGHLGFAALVMFVIVFVWTPPHFWALALMIKEHYARRERADAAGRARRRARPRKQIVRYTIVLIAVTLAPVALGIFGLVYGVSALVLGALFLLARGRAAAHARSRRRREALPLLAALSRAALRRDGPRHGDLDGRTAHRRRDRPQEHALGLGALRPLLPALRRHGRRRLHLPLAFIERRLDHRAAAAGPPAGGSRSRTSSTRRGSGRRTARPSSPTTCRRGRPRRCCGSSAPAGRTSGRRTCTSSPTASTSQNLHYGAVPNPRVPGPDARRLVGRVGGGARARPRRRRARDGHGRLDSHPGRLLRHHRAQADLRARPDRRRLPARAVVRPRGADGSRRRRLHRVDARSRPRLLGRATCPSTISRSPSPGATCPCSGTPVDVSDRRGGRAGVHARGRRRPPRALRRAGGALRREHPRQDRTVPRRRATASTTARVRGARASTRSGPSRRSTGHDLLVTPTLGVPSAAGRRRSRSRSASALTLFTFPFNALGWPALALPAGRSSIQVVGRPGDDALVLAAGLALERRAASAAMSADLAFAHFLADAADAITLARFRSLDLHVETKPDLTPVSEADRAAEEALRALVAASGRGEGVLGEEFGDDGGDVKWIVDPIDGTSNYVRGVPVWATLLALAAGGRGRGRARVGSRARPPLVGGARARAPSRTASGAASPPSPGSRTARSRRRRRAACRPAGARSSQRAWSNRGLGDFWQHCLVAEGSLDVACDSVAEAVGLRGGPAARRGGRRPLHDLRRRAAGARRELPRHERRAARRGRLAARALSGLSESDRPGSDPGRA